MAKDPVCGMYVEEKPDVIRHSVEGKEYFFCSNQCLDEFTAPEKELKKLKRYVAISIGLTLPITVLTYVMLLPTAINNYVLLALATPVQFWIGWRFYRGLWDGIKAKTSNMDTLIAVGTSAAYFYSAIITIMAAGSLTSILRVRQLSTTNCSAPIAVIFLRCFLWDILMPIDSEPQANTLQPSGV